MVVLILSASPASLRGAITRWLLEVSPGVFVGHLSARVREQLWELVRAYIGDGRALLIWSARSEQHFEIASLGHDRDPVDIEGCIVMRTPYRQIEGAKSIPGAIKPAKESWSIAARRRRFRNSTERALGQQ
ncbi:MULTISPECIES: type I-E CRISPR-associated endoribonuclease Cas2e [unclassified Actinomyces]|uniref:type I-E CRISPR-associated endoribonuclease Cas2e n=1 Tax=unclassified Actinomyces TaxID=2609248 RepID=UPI000D597049|nr:MULTISPECIES: type I-E CRISPR-associated endoribonuclease Cas2e [unclassified Actinomyces]MBE6476208.1 type I-E CRISPR-associated endoribonuclease Cas2 [Actinomyces succiniciruminis]MBM6980291.1 type I-E CRISPR-associated endoribonuclease Cas2 [Actinomyces succiniciruminis]RAX19274.1 type I-E CRISPR-associated endoribonuclease Cas2 [Actinomyces sp. Z5]RAX22172.1 type I-E CRISPR-associated endoribonuclease Cas2 [Actinomyces sp. Z3]